MKLTTKSLLLSTATFGLMLGVAQNAQAGRLITGVTATSLTGTGSNWALANVTNGSGLPGNQPSLGGVHALSSSANAWRSFNTAGAQLAAGNVISITFQLGTIPTDLIGFSFWNTTGADSTTIGVRNASLGYSTNGTTFTSAWTGTFAQGGTTPGGPELINFNLVKATYVRLNITSNYGDGQRVGFNEISFKSIPEPSASLALLGLGLAGVGLRKRA
ncbi:MAG: PEP-CTERM sorting domain-containing protein [Microcystis sp.]